MNPRTLLRAWMLPALFLGCTVPSVDDAGGGGGDAGEDAGLDGGQQELVDDLPAGRCRTANDCPDVAMIGVMECAPPEAVRLERSACGACLGEADDCASDDDCGPGFACRPEGPCGCGEQTLVCVDGCQSNGDCLVGQICDDEAHCVQAPCASTADCPSQLECVAPDNVCARPACGTDAECAGGYCVDFLCFSEPGTCVENPPVP